jgi:serine/threonine-protein kinase
MRTLTFNRVIGSGAMGTVYLAELRVPRGFSRTCAVKVMKSNSPDHSHFVARMRDEARLLGMLQDEQVLGVSELVLVEGRDAVVMEYVEGVDLADLIAKQRVPPRALSELGAEIAGTLHRAHTARHPTTGEHLKVIHRDIKPANVMITSRGGVRLLDFGVARAAFASRESQTQGLVLGTLNYFPPEILAGSEPTQAVDVYGLGLTLWECATGRSWGAPQVQQERFERRVDKRLEEIESEYAALIPVLRQVLQWDPQLRPDGGVVERALLHAADACVGEGLRTWARTVVPGLLEERDKKRAADPLVGRTVPIESPEGDLTGPTALRPAPADPSRFTYNDFGPPSASRALARDDDGVADEEITAARPTPAPPPPRPRPRRPERAPTSLVWFAILGVAVGFLVALALIVVAIAVVLFVLNGM